MKRKSKTKKISLYLDEPTATFLRRVAKLSKKSIGTVIAVLLAAKLESEKYE